MINPRKVATLGLGFGALAISAIGLIADAPVLQPSRPPVYYGGGASSHAISTTSKEKPSVVIADYINEDDDEAVICFVLAEAIRIGVL